MSPEYLKEPPKVIRDFEQAMKDLLGDQAEDLELLKDIPNIQHALVQHEVRRLDRKLGRDHPRVKNLRSNLAHNTDVVRSFSPDVEKDPEEETPVPSDDSIIMGRLVDEKNIAMVGMTVDIEDESGRKIPNIGGVRTDDAGNFFLRIDPENADKVKSQVGGTGYLTVRDHKGKVVHQDAAPLRPNRGGQMSMNVSVSTEKFSGKEQVLKPRGPIPRPPMDAGYGKRSPGTASLDGKGGDVTARLDGKGDDMLTGKRDGLTGPVEMMKETPTIFTPSMSEGPGKPAEFKPAEFHPGKETAKVGVSMGGNRMDSEDEDFGEEVVSRKGNVGLGRVGMDESEEGDYGEDVVMGKGKGGIGSTQAMPPGEPPGPRPEESRMPTGERGTIMRGKGKPKPDEDPFKKMRGVELKKMDPKKMSRKERKQMGK